MNIFRRLSTNLVIMEDRDGVKTVRIKILSPSVQITDNELEIEETASVRMLKQRILLGLKDTEIISVSL